MSRRLRSLLLICLACGTLIAAAAGAGTSQSAPPGAVAVFPAEGTPIANPKTQISFRGASRSDLQNRITATGSTSGAHAGTLRAHSDGQGASFLPAVQFTPGETVTVHANGVSLVGEEPGHNVTFKIALPPGTDSGIAPAPSDPGGDPADAHHFHSRPELKPPTLNVTRTGAGPVARGNYFLGIKQGKGQDGALIANGAGSPIYFLHSRGPIFDVRKQQLNGKPVFTFWQGQFLLGVGFGHSYVYDSHYRRIKTISAGNGYLMGLHETQFTNHGTVLVLFYDKVGADLTGVQGGHAGQTLLDSGVQEIDLKTGLVEFEWHSFDQVPLADSYAPRTNGLAWDYTHVNSVKEARDGNLLISARNTSAVYKVDRKTGKVIWTLGGKPNPPVTPNKSGDFTLVGPNSNWRTVTIPVPSPHTICCIPFQAQHDVHQQADGTYSIFDDGSPPPLVPKESRGLVLNVNETAKTVTLVHQYRHPGNPPIKTFSQGSVERLSNGNFLVGWGGPSVPFVSEYSPSGALVRDVKFAPSGDDTYRAYMFDWHAVAPGKPTIAVQRSSGKTDIWVSWNGATEVAKWRVYGGKHKTHLHRIKTKSNKGFETHIKISGHPRYVRVFALDSHGHVIGKSRRAHP